MFSSRGSFFLALMLATLNTTSAEAQQKKFTTNEDFDGGTGSNVCHGPAPKIDCWDPAPDQLVLGRTQVSKLNRVWADNYYMGWIVGLDATTGKQIARFDSAVVSIDGQATGASPPKEYCDFSSTGNCPGRVAVDTNGNVWIINRAFGKQGSLSKFSGTIDHCIDRNGNSIIETSNDANNDGIVNPDDPAEYFGQNDECILATLPLGGVNHVPRGVAVDKKGKIWASTFNGRQVFRFNPNGSVPLEATINLDQTGAAGCSPYSIATGGDYVFLSCHGSKSGARIHIDSLQVDGGPCRATYGVVASADGSKVYLGGWTSQTGLRIVDYANNPSVCLDAGGGALTAVTLDDDGNVWGAFYGASQLIKYTATGEILGSYGTGANPHGLSVDFGGRLWSVCHQVPFIYAHNAATGANISGTFPFTPSLTAQGNYNYDEYLYSDFTGAQIDRQAPYLRLGSWSGVHDALLQGAPWTSVTWNTELPDPIPAETSILVAARAADTQELLGQAAFVSVQNGAPVAGIQGRFVELKVDFNGPGYLSPVLTDLTVSGPCGDTLGAACCLSDLDCADENPCTTGTCSVAGGPCDQVKTDNCCVINKDCDDGLNCTIDICTGFDGTCEHKVISGCCYEDKDCDTGNKCLSAKCPAPGKLCELTPVPGCCNVDGDCNDNNACTLDACDAATNTCKLPEKIAGCCLADGECDDQNPCTTDVCSGPGGQCKHAEIAECCVPGGPGEGDPCDPPKPPNDKAPCAGGKKKCNGETSQFECEGAVKPKPESCDGVDNDCDGELDNGEALCPAGKLCAGGDCVTPGGAGGSAGGQGGGNGISGSSGIGLMERRSIWRVAAAARCRGPRGGVAVRWRC